MALNNDLVSFEARIENILARAREAGLDDELRSALSRFACVLASGYVEEAVRTIVGAWCNAKAHPYIQAFVGRKLDRFLNPKVGKIQELLGEFGQGWAERFSAELSDEERDAINSIVSNRHLIAHGRNVGISPVQVQAYFGACMQAVRKLDAIVGA